MELLMVAGLVGSAYLWGRRSGRRQTTPLMSSDLRPLKVNTSDLDVENIQLGFEQQKMFEKIESSSSHFFVTGKAGTGKSALLQYLKHKSKKKLITTAFTGVASLNIGAPTIHSLFQLPHSFIDTQRLVLGHMDSRLETLLRNVDMLVIDEISMVRADMMDAIEVQLRKARESEEPFGGVQIVMFGDLYQLPPIVKDRELHKYFAHNHGGPFFFNAHVWNRAEMDIFELRQNFRQKDDGEFRKVLDAIREGNFIDTILVELNKRSKVSVPDSGIITLATTNKIVDSINHDKLASLGGNLYRYRAEISGDSEHFAFPADEILKLKKGAQVMLLKNDKEKRWVNGTVGVVTSLSDIEIKVNIDGITHSIPRETWKEVRYRYDQEKHKIEEEIVSQFTQFPLRLAWAMTVHKSQGKTYSSALVNMGNGAFTHGQTYVALSRCTSLEGLYLERPIARKDIIIDPVVVTFMKRVQIHEV